MPNPHGLLLGLVHLDFLPHLVEEYLKKINIRWEVACMNLTIKTDWQTQKSLGHQGMDSLRSSLFCFLLAGESKSQGEVTRTHWVREKRGTGGRGWGGKEKPWAEPWHFTKRRSSTNGRQLGITIGQSRVNQNDQCQQLVNSRISGMIRSDQLWP